MATGAATYDYGYARTAQTYDTSKTYYQQAGAATGYTAPATYETGAAAKVILLVTFIKVICLTILFIQGLDRFSSCNLCSTSTDHNPTICKAYSVY